MQLPSLFNIIYQGLAGWKILHEQFKPYSPFHCSQSQPFIWGHAILKICSEKKIKIKIYLELPQHSVLTLDHCVFPDGRAQSKPDIEWTSGIARSKLCHKNWKNSLLDTSHWTGFTSFPSSGFNRTTTPTDICKNFGRMKVFNLKNSWNLGSYFLKIVTWFLSAIATKTILFYKVPRFMD